MSYCSIKRDLAVNPATHRGLGRQDEAVRGPPRAPRPRPLASDALSDGGWSEVLRLEGYAPRSPCRPEGLQQTLFAYHQAWG